jgi:hypothetical protein
LAQTKLSCLWNKPRVAEGYRAAVSLHSHTNHSKESLDFIPKFAERWSVLQWALERQCQRSRIPVDFARAFWTPPLAPKLAFEAERDQIENVLGLAGLVSLTDHDNIEAPTLLRMVAEAGQIPFALEWSVPFEDAIFHLGVHNLPDARAHEIMADLAAYTQNPSSRDFGELIEMLDQSPDVLIIFNHPLWDLSRMGEQAYRQVLGRFLQSNGRFLHAFELNATRPWKENSAVVELAERWQRPVISGGDRHGCEPSGALNLTRALSFSEFVHEIRVEQRSHVLFMPQYAEPRCLRITQALLDVIREYPEYAVGSQRWDDRVFHPVQASDCDQSLSTLWKAAPAFIEQIFSAIRLVENSAVRHLLTHVLRGQASLQARSDVALEATL